MIDVFRQILSSYNIKGNFFVVGELAHTNRHLINDLIQENHEVGYHSWNHTRPLTLSISDYYERLVNSKKDFEYSANVGSFDTSKLSSSTSILDILKRMRILQR